MAARRIALMVERPCHSGAVTQFPEDRETLLVEGTCLSIITLQFDDVRQIAESTSHGSAVTQFSPDRQALLEEGARLRNASPVAGNDSQCVERDGNAPVIFRLARDGHAFADQRASRDRKSTRLNSSHMSIS